MWGLIMGEKLYRPVLKDGKHLDKSRKTPNRVRGVARDANNKNPDIIEWEEVEQEEQLMPNYNSSTSMPESTPEEQHDLLDSIVLLMDSLARLSEVLAENPEIIEGGIKLYNYAKDGLIKGAGKVKGLTGHLPWAKKKTTVKVNFNEDDIEKTVVTTPETGIVLQPSDKKEREEMSVEDARILVLNILTNYIHMKKDLEKLQNANINGVDMPKIDMNKLLESMDALTEKYPALMDAETMNSVIKLLSENPNLDENRKVKEALKIGKGDQE